MTLAAMGVGRAGASGIIGSETQYMGYDFAYPNIYQRMIVKDTTTSANNYYNDPFAKLTYTSPSAKMCLQSDGIYRFQSHNLYINSATPANQSITVLSGAAYAVVITGSVSITWSGAWSGTTTAGTNNFTATTATATAGSTSGTGTVTVYRTPCVGAYLATAGAAVYALPYEWDLSGNLLGLLCEDSKTNLCLRSNDLTNASWTKTAMTTAFTSTGPDGVANHATRCTASGANATALQAITSASASRVSAMFVKRITGSGTINITSDNGTTWTTVTVTSAWTKVSSTNQTLTNPTVGLRIVTSGDAIDVAYFQHELNVFATSPIETFGATVTRAADSLKLATSNFPLSATAGAFVVKVSFQGNTGGANYLVTLDDGTANNFTAPYSGNLSASMINTVAATNNVNTTATGTFTVGTPAKMGLAWAANDFACLFAGGTAATDTVATLPTVNTFWIGNRSDLARATYGWIQQITYLPRRVSNTELQARTL